MGASQRHKCEVHGEASGVPSTPCPAYENVPETSPGAAPVWVGPVMVPELTSTVEMDEIDMDNFANGGSTWAVTTGTLPDGLSLAALTGVLSGTPTTPGVTSGLVITATNAAGATESEPFDITVV